MDWNSDGEWDIISGDREGYLNVFIRRDSTLTGYKQYRLIDGTVLDVGYNSEPNVFDWNADGRKDLVIGTQDYYVRLYLNQGADTWPMFQDYSIVQAGGSAIYLYRVNPYVFDLDEDGRQDIICGENNGYVHFFRNLGPDSAPVFAQGETLKLEDGTPVRWMRTAYYYGSRCGFGDWNNDGTPDLLLSTYEGQIEFYRGVPMTGLEEGRSVPHGALVVSPVPGKPPVTITACGPVEITDRTGRVVCSLPSPGAKSNVLWSGTDDSGQRLPAGVYLCRDQSSGATGRIVLLQ